MLTQPQLMLLDLQVGLPKSSNYLRDGPHFRMKNQQVLWFFTRGICCEVAYTTAPLALRSYVIMYTMPDSRIASAVHILPEINVNLT